jgi:hypothetical protein
VARAAAPRYGAEAYAHAGGAGRAAVSRRAQRDVAASAQHAMEEEVRGSFFLGLVLCLRALLVLLFFPLFFFPADHRFPPF